MSELVVKSFRRPVGALLFIFKENNFWETGRYEMKDDRTLLFSIFVKIDEDVIVQKDNLLKTKKVRCVAKT
jgi:hypothetical protein